MILRDLTPALKANLRRYPVVTLLGPRQSGKTTLAQTTSDKPYANLESPDVRAFAQQDPRGFLAQFPKGGVLDEIQRVPELLSWIQTDADAVNKPGRWILTGSHQPALRNAVAQSLAGRTALLRLLPLSLGELAGAGINLEADALIVAGGFPRLYAQKIPPARWHADYLATYAERDVRSLATVRDISTFQRYMGLLAGRTGSAVNWSQLGADAGVSEVTAKAWAGLLEAGFLAQELRPWYANLGQRLKKHPKVYWSDTGLASFLTGVTDAAHLTTHPARGGLFENLIVSETFKALAHWESSARAWFLSTAREEVDLIIEAGGGTLAVEIKSGRTVAGEWADKLRKATPHPALRTQARMVVYGGDEIQTRGDVEICPWWLYPARLAAWLRKQDAAPHAPNPKKLEAILRAGRKAIA